MNETLDIKIVPATPEDAFTIQELIYQSSIGMYEMAGYELSDIEARFTERHSKEKLDSLKKNIEESSSDEKYIVAKSNGTIVGFCYGEKESERNIVHALYVIPELQRKGVGLLLWKSVKDWLGDKDIYLNVIDLNRKAIIFYESLGFETTGAVVIRPGLTQRSELRDIEMVLRK